MLKLDKKERKALAQKKWREKKKREKKEQ
jgi:hypothetical protein